LSLLSLLEQVEVVATETTSTTKQAVAVAVEPSFAVGFPPKTRVPSDWVVLVP
jgi:hypothetical protein